MKIRLFVILFLISISSKSQFSYWKFYGQGRLNDCIVTHDSLLVAVGSGFKVLKTDLNSNLIWQQNYPVAGSPDAFTVVETPDHYLLIGGRQGTSIENQRLIKIDMQGNLVWDVSPGTGSITAIAVDNRGYYRIIHVDDPGSNSDVYISELDTSGSVIWQSSINLMGNDRGWGLCIDHNDNAYVVGNSNAGAGNIYSFIAKFDSSGALADTVVFSGSITALYDIVMLNDSEFVASGGFSEFIGDYDLWLLKFNDNCDSINSKRINYNITGHSIYRDEQLGGFIVSGAGNDTVTSDQNVYVLWFDSLFNQQQLVRIDSTDYDGSFGFDVFENVVYVVGNSFFNITDSSWICAIDTSLTTISEEYSYPTNVTVIVNNNFIQVIDGNNSILRIYDLLGRVFVSKKLNSVYEEIMTDKLREGIYFLELLAPDRRRSVFKIKL